MNFYVEFNDDGKVVARYESATEPFVPHDNTVEKVGDLSSYSVEEPRF